MTHPRERLTAYADGELAGAAAADVEKHLETCTECAREVAVVHRLKGALQDMHLLEQKDVWRGVHRRLTTPAGWLLILIGAAIWVVLGVVRWFQEELTAEWLAGTALITGLALLLIAVGHEQYRAWKGERYKDVER